MSTLRLDFVSQDHMVFSGEVTEILAPGSEGQLVSRATPFYGESGGQVGDTGTIMADVGVFVVTDTKVAGQETKDGAVAVTVEVRDAPKPALVAECRFRYAA